MLSLLLSGLVALAQAAPYNIAPRPIHDFEPVSPDLGRDYDTLSKFIKTVSGPGDITGNWTGDFVCSWDGFYCEVNPDTNLLSLASIDFNGFQLTGHLKLSGWLEKLTDLALLHLNSNSFGGEIPDLSALKYLYEVDLSNNKFSGPFPHNLLSVQALTFLDLRFNRFTGPIPAEAFSAYVNITALFLNNNRFSGQIPNSISSFQGNYLSLANNKLTGPIPAGLAKATYLKEFVALGNKLTGYIPTGLSACVELEVFDVSNNQLTGTVPEDLCGIPTIKTIVVTGNKIVAASLGPVCKQALANGILQI